MKRFLIPMLFLSMIILGSCDGNDNSADNEIKKAKYLNLDTNEWNAGYNGLEFSLNMLDSDTLDGGKNIFFSPLNMMITNGILLNCTTGETQRELLDAMGYSGNIEDLNSYISIVQNELPNLDPTSRYINGVSICSVNQTLTPGSELEQLFKNNYNAEIFETKDVSSSEFLSNINKWIEDKTDGFINGHFKNPFSSEISLFSLNTLYLKGKWKDPFDKKRTKEETFFNASGENVKVEMMKGDMSYRAIKEDNYSAVRIPMGNEAFQMIIVLPNEGVSVDECTQYIATEKFLEFYTGNHTSTIHISLPKFNLESSFNCMESYKSQGVNKIFTRDAEFKLGGTSGNNIQIGDISQFVKFKIDEDGCQVGNVIFTGLTTADTPMAPQEMDFIVNRPFIVIVRERSTPCPLLIGKIYNL